VAPRVMQLEKEEREHAHAGRTRNSVTGY
jgi:hypothetical protein